MISVLLHVLKYPGKMNWKKLKKIIVPLLIIKILFLIFFFFKSDLISISRDITSDNNYIQGTEINDAGQGHQKLIRIVRNEEDRGIIIKLRAKKHHRLLEDDQSKPSNPVVD